MVCVSMCLWVSFRGKWFSTFVTVGWSFTVCYLKLLFYENLKLHVLHFSTYMLDKASFHLILMVVGMVDHPKTCQFYILISLRLLMLPWTSKVASLCCQMPSMICRASSSPCLTQSMICREKFLIPHSEKCLPSGVDRSLISVLWPACLRCIASVVLPTYCFPQIVLWSCDLAVHVTK